MIPLSSDQYRKWTPEPLRNMPVPPVFIIRPARWNDKGRLQDMMVSEGLTFHDNTSLDAEMLRALQALWTPEAFEQNAQRAQESLAALRDGSLTDAEEIGFLADLLEGIRENWPRYNKMLAQNQQFYREWPKIVVSMMVVGWQNLETRFEREAGVATMKCLAAVQAELDKMDEDLEPGTAGTSFMLLGAEAVNEMGLSETARKNSSPESPSTGTQDGSTPAGTKGSKALSAKSKESPGQSRSSSGAPTSRRRKTPRAA